MQLIPNSVIWEKIHQKKKKLLGKHLAELEHKQSTDKHRKRGQKFQLKGYRKPTNYSSVFQKITTVNHNSNILLGFYI